jgi:putative transposase
VKRMTRRPNLDVKPCLITQGMLGAELPDVLEAEKGERPAARLGYRSGVYSHTLLARVGPLELRVPQDRD